MTEAALPRRTQSRLLGFAACALASGFWGCGFFFGKIALAEMNVGSMVFYRFLFAAIAVTPLLFTRRPHFSAADWRMLLLATLLGVPLQFLVQFEGLSLTTVSHASLMVGTMPVILAVGATMFAYEKLNAIGWSSLALSTAGAALIVFGRHPSALGSTDGAPSLRGDLLVVLSLCIALFWILLNQRLLRTHSASLVTAYGTVLGMFMLALIVPVLFGAPALHGISSKVWEALIASGVLCTASTTLLWNWGMTQVPASQAGVLLNIEPLVGSLLGVLVLKEKLGPAAWLGGGMIVFSALTLTTRGGARAAD